MKNEIRRASSAARYFGIAAVFTAALGTPACVESPSAPDEEQADTRAEGLAATRDAIVQIAKSQIDQTSGAKYGAPAGAAWCSYFATWVWRSAGVDIPSYGYSGNVITWAKNNGLWKPNTPAYQPEPGDAVLYATDAYSAHIGVVVAVNGDIIDTVEGNYASRVSFRPGLNRYTATNGGGYGIYGFAAPIVGGAPEAPPDTPQLLDFEAFEGTQMVGQNLDGRLEVFVRGADGGLWHTAQTEPNGDWNPWSPLGGSLAAPPAVGRSKDGRLEVFYMGQDKQIWHLWQLGPGGDWSGHLPEGGVLASVPVVASNADGHLELFVTGSDRQIWHKWQLPDLSWSPWAPLGGSLKSAPVLAQDADGRLEIFYRGTDDSLYQLWQTEPNGGWSAHGNMGGTLASPPSAGINADGRLEVFYVGGDGAVWHAWQWTAGGNWSGHDSLGGRASTRVAVGRNKDGRMEIVYAGANGEVTHQWEWKPGDAWSFPDSLGGTMASDPLFAANADGHLEIFYRGTDWQMWHLWQGEKGWSDHVPMTGQLSPF
jgi:hypothetical protein